MNENPEPIRVANLESQYDQKAIVAKCGGVASYLLAAAARERKAYKAWLTHNNLAQIVSSYYSDMSPNQDLIDANKEIRARWEAFCAELNVVSGYGLTEEELDAVMSAIEAERAERNNPNAAILEGVERTVFASVALRYYEARWRLTRPRADIEENPNKEPRFGFVEFCEHQGLDYNKLSPNDFAELLQTIAKCVWEDLTGAKRSNDSSGTAGAVQTQC